MFTTGGRRGACAFFLTGSEERVRVSLLRVRLLRMPVSLVFPPSRQPDRNRSCRTFIRSGRCEMVFRCTSARVSPLACVYLLSCESRRCRHVNASAAVRCDRRLMSPRHSRARVCHFDSIRYSSQRSPSTPPLHLVFLLFNRLLRILSLDRADTARRTCTYAPLSPHDRISRLIHLRMMPSVI